MFSNLGGAENHVQFDGFQTEFALESFDRLPTELPAILSSDNLHGTAAPVSAEGRPLRGNTEHVLARQNVDGNAKQIPCFSTLSPSHASDINAAVPTVVEYSGYAMTNEDRMDVKDVFPLSKDELLAEIDLFAAEAYECYPIVNMDSLIQNMLDGKHLSDPDFSTLALSIVMTNAALEFRRSPQQGTARLDALIENIESIRLNAHDYFFADMPSLDTVTVSWCLFMAYIFHGRSYKGFAYLTEAIGFLDLVAYPSNPDEVARLHRLEYMIFITESGAISLFGPPGKRRIARCPAPSDNADALLFSYHRSDRLKEFGLQKMVALDRQAVDLLLLMGRLHAALGPDDVAHITVDERFTAAMSGALIGDTNQGKHVSIQTADVAITRQWKLGSHWLAVLRASGHLVQHRIALSYMLQTLGMTTLQWVNALTPEQLRVINPGKLVALMDIIINMASAIQEETSCTNVVRDLISTVSKVDYERAFAAQLSMFEFFIQRIPCLMAWNEGRQREGLQDKSIEDTGLFTDFPDQIPTP